MGSLGVPPVSFLFGLAFASASLVARAPRPRPFPCRFAPAPFGCRALPPAGGCARGALLLCDLATARSAWARLVFWLWGASSLSFGWVGLRPCGRLARLRHELGDVSLGVFFALRARGRRYAGQPAARSATLRACESLPRTCSACPDSSLATTPSSGGCAAPLPLRGQPAARSAPLRACESSVRCVPPRGRSTRHREGAFCGVALATARHARLRSLFVPLVHRVLAPRARAEISSPLPFESALRPQSVCRGHCPRS